jgi:hypothetical protein
MDDRAARSSCSRIPRFCRACRMDAIPALMDDRPIPMNDSASRMHDRTALQKNRTIQTNERTILRRRRRPLQKNRTARMDERLVRMNDWLPLTYDRTSPLPGKTGKMPRAGAGSSVLAQNDRFSRGFSSKYIWNHQAGGGHNPRATSSMISGSEVPSIWQ